MLINLLSNAIKFSPENTQIVIQAGIDKNTLALTVKDNGIGISEEDQQHLFSSFFRGKNAINIQGTGLDLHIVKRYIELIDGTIGLESKLHQGTSVTISIPNLFEE